ncbi:hypothetical protein EYF80_030365 [Liparis tanakae]|uniref:Uncharacterized protein n=1 Tax=Liparis tanakae TaxID=230148 RepID=A0A4Z2H1X0_9TELE|nr:hypothetical protein EYF80_030365 [Liparis tanakae]
MVSFTYVNKSASELDKQNPSSLLPSLLLLSPSLSPSFPPSLFGDSQVRAASVVVVLRNRARASNILLADDTQQSLSLTLSVLDLGPSKVDWSLLDLGLSKGDWSLLDLGLSKGDWSLLDLGLSEVDWSLLDLGLSTVDWSLLDLGLSKVDWSLLDLGLSMVDWSLTFKRSW